MGTGCLLGNNPNRRLQDFVAAFRNAFDGPRHRYGRLNSNAVKLRPILVQRLQTRPAYLEPTGEQHVIGVSVGSSGWLAHQLTQLIVRHK